MIPALWSLLDVIRGTHPINEDAVGFLLQLLVWKKLESDPRLRGLQPLATTRRGAGLASAIEQTMQHLHSSSGLGPDAIVFEKPMLELRHFAEAKLEWLVNALEQLPPDSVSTEDCVTLLESAAASSKSGPGLLSSDLTRLMLNMLGVSRGLEVYIPFDSSWLLCLRAAMTGARVFGEFRSNRTSRLVHLINLFAGLGIQMSNSDPLHQPSWLRGGQLRRFTACVSAPPFGLRLREDILDPYGRFPRSTSNGDVLNLWHIRSQTSGRAVVLVPNGLLFRTTSSEQDFKWDLVAKGHLNAIVSLPSGVLNLTNAPSTLLVLDFSASTRDVMMIDATSGDFTEGGASRTTRKLRGAERILEVLQARAETSWSRAVSLDECGRNDFNLLPERYVRTKTQTRVQALLSRADTEELGHLVDFLRLQAVRADEEDEGVVEFREVSLQDFGSDDYVQTPKKTIQLGRKAAARSMQQCIEPGDILLVIKGAAVGRVALVPPALPEPWLANQSFLVLRMKPRGPFDDPVILMRYLASPLGQAMLSNRAGGNNIPVLQVKDVRTLPVIIPGRKEQEGIMSTNQKIIELNRRVHELQLRCNELRESLWSLEAEQEPESKASEEEIRRQELPAKKAHWKPSNVAPKKEPVRQHVRLSIRPNPR